MNKKIIIGKINGFYGVKGFVKVFSYGRPRESILDYPVLWIFKDNQWEEFTVKSAKVATKHLVMQFEGYPDKDSVVPLLGCSIGIDHNRLPQLKEGEYYWVDLIGLTVINNQNEVLGKIDDILETGANDVLVIKNNKKELLVPYIVGDTILNVDYANKTILIDWETDD